MSTPVGQKGRLPPGESWRRAMAEVAGRFAQGSRKRYRVRGRRIEDNWWAYSVTRAKDLPPVAAPPAPDTRPVHERVADMTRGLPRCVQRAKARHGGDFKVAFTDRRIALRVTALTGGVVYPCQLPAPAIGDHWHITTTKKKRRM